MLVSINDIIKYIKEIPPTPTSVKNTLLFLKKGELKKAALEANKDIALKKQIEKVVNSAYFALPNKVTDTVQLFSMLGIEMVKSLVYAYLISLLEPKKWQIFNIPFYDFQASFMKNFEKYMILEFSENEYKKYAEVGAIIPAAVCVCDSLLGNKKKEVDIIMNSAPIEYGTLLKRLTGYSLFDIAGIISKEWELEDEKIEVVKKSDCSECNNKYAALVHFLFFYLSSQKNFLDINSLIEFNTKCIEFVPKTYERIVNDS